MSKQAFDKIKAGLEDALAYAKGEADESQYVVHIPPTIDVHGIRKKLGLTQAQFAARYGFSLARVRDWEQGRSQPDGAARAYLIVISQDHEAVDRALHAA
jgi:putative transcriptional regulator